MAHQDVSPARMATASATWAAAAREASADSSSPASCNLTSMLSESWAKVDLRVGAPGLALVPGDPG
jgi:hypothetical protein